MQSNFRGVKMGCNVDGLGIKQISYLLHPRINYTAQSRAHQGELDPFELNFPIGNTTHFKQMQKPTKPNESTSSRG